jgi:hypothetical protein
MTTAAEYRQYAEECLEAMRAALFVAAQRWTVLAEETAQEEVLADAAHSRHAGDVGAGAPN